MNRFSGLYTRDYFCECKPKELFYRAKEQPSDINNLRKTRDRDSGRGLLSIDLEESGCALGTPTGSHSPATWGLARPFLQQLVTTL
ncbi:hypothetical protein KQX54_004464 [Cotesia glomerata]|uniref:Uncharacterized protein n=1 Tax=Cotesia glomerata TaxID=32391 RepID=A0AAV7HVU7_COTGL|nr:hypothetical protein KQX54_004464 [Cotesia glomerata]